MSFSSDKKVVLITRKTRLDDLVSRFNTVGQARFYVEHLGADFEDYLEEHARYEKAMRETVSHLQRVARVQVVERSFLPNFLFGEDDTVVALGQDGLVANTLKYLDHQPLVGVNPDPERWEGLLLPFKVPDLKKAAAEILAGRRRRKSVTMARAALSDGQSIYGVNDLFIGRKTHVSARYELRFGRASEQQSSSGVIVSTGLGYSGWMRSVVRGATGVTAALGGKRIKAAQTRNWDERRLYFAVREPYPGATTGTDLVYGEIKEGEDLKIVSAMPEEGVIFSDGMEQDYLVFTSGFEARITVAEKQGNLVV